jgi:cytosine deaminase
MSVPDSAVPLRLTADEPAAPPVVLRAATLPGRAIADVSFGGGRITAMTEAGELEPGAGEVIDLRGYLLLPSLVEPHAHLDKAFTADIVTNPDGSLYGAISAWLPVRAGFQRADIAARAWRVALRYLAHGTTAIRAHVDAGEDIGLKAVEGILAVREALAGVVEIQIVASCNVPVTGVAGATNRAVLADALAAGVDRVGGAPAIDGARIAAIDALWAIWSGLETERPGVPAPAA